MSDLTPDRFLKTVRQHKLTIVRNDGVNHHLKFSDGTFNCAFEIVTWEGSLCITGDCGTYVFERTSDMFEFFRSAISPLEINPHYWGEKLVSTSVTGGYKEFSYELFLDAVKADFEDWEFESDEQKEQIWEDVQNDVLDQAANGEAYAVAAIGDYRSEADHSFTDFYEHNIEVFTHHYLWNLYAIVYVIGEFDKAVKGQEKAGYKPLTEKEKERVIAYHLKQGVDAAEAALQIVLLEMTSAREGISTIDAHDALVLAKSKAPQ